MTKVFDAIKKDFLRFAIVTVLFLNFGTGALNFFGRDAVPAYLADMVHKMDVVYAYTTDEMVRFVEKQYTKVTEKPDDFYTSDLEYLFDNVWPSIPDSRKTQSLTSKYQYLMEYYNNKLSETRFVTNLCVFG